MGFFGSGRKTALVDAKDALSGRDRAMPVRAAHFVNGHPLVAPWPEGFEVAYVAMGCFWGAERLFWQTPGVWSTAVGYQGGFTQNPTYQETCSAKTGHTEAVMVVFDPTVVSYEQILKVFWEGHNPTQGMRQGNDVGSQYRSAAYTTSSAQASTLAASRDAFQQKLKDAGLGEITTEVAPAGSFFYAEEYHQQYLAKNPGGYCGLGGTGVSCPVGVAKAD